MSGGHWNYQQDEIISLMRDIKEDECVKKILKKIPKLDRISCEISMWLFDYIKDLDWHISGDTIIDCFEGYEDNMLYRLKKIIGEKNGK